MPRAESVSVWYVVIILLIVGNCNSKSFNYHPPIWNWLTGLCCRGFCYEPAANGRQKITSCGLTLGILVQFERCWTVFMKTRPWGSWGLCFCLVRSEVQNLRDFLSLCEQPMPEIVAVDSDGDGEVDFKEPNPGESGFHSISISPPPLNSQQPNLFAFSMKGKMAEPVGPGADAFKTPPAKRASSYDSILSKDWASNGKGRVFMYFFGFPATYCKKKYVLWLPSHSFLCCGLWRPIWHTI